MRKILFIFKIFQIGVISAIFIFPFFVPANAAVDSYVPLAPIPKVDTVNFKDQSGAGLSTYVKNMYQLGVGIATILAVIMIMWGGIEYMSTDAIGGKEGGKEKINNALLGLLLAVASFLILRTINIELVNSKLSLEAVNAPQNNLVVSIIPLETAAVSGPIPQPGTNGLAGLKDDGETAAQAIARNAEYAANANHPLNTCSAEGTNGGRKACAYAVNEIVEGALGKPITNSLGTADMYQALKTSSSFEQISGGLSAALPGDIIISPTQGANTGHVGICDGAGCSSIISNSSSRAKVEANYNASTWSSYYGGKGLDTYVFRPK